MSPDINDLNLWSDFSASSTQDWENKLRADLKGRPLSSLNWETEDGLTVSPFYTSVIEPVSPLPRAVSDSSTLKPNGWLVGQTVTHSKPKSANLQALRAISQGATAISFHAAGTATNGIVIKHQADLEVLLDGIDWTATSLNWRVGFDACAFLGMLANIAESTGIDLSQVKGSIGFDPFSYLLKFGRIDKSIVLAIAENLFSAANDLELQLRILRINASPIREAGGTAVQELAYLLGVASEWCTLLGDSLPVSELANRIHLACTTGTSFFTEIAKMRALRLLMPLVYQAYGLDIKLIQPIYLESQSSMWDHSGLDTEVNLLRGTTQATAAIVAGCDELHISPYDALLGHATTRGLRLALNSSHILQHEAHLNRVVDPARGSYFIESLTQQMARTAWAEFKEIESQGGMLSVLESGYFQGRISESRALKKKHVAAREKVLVGSNGYVDTSKEALSIQKSILPITEATNSYLEDLEFEFLRKRLHEGASLSSLKIKSVSPSMSIAPLPFSRASFFFEEMRSLAASISARHSDFPCAHVITVDEDSKSRSLGSFARDVFEVCGFQIEEWHLKDDAAELISATENSQATVLAFCCEAERKEECKEVLGRLRAGGRTPQIVWLHKPEAEKEHDIPDTYFVYPGANISEAMTSLLKRVGKAVAK